MCKETYYTTTIILKLVLSNKYFLKVKYELIATLYNVRILYDVANVLYVLTDRRTCDLFLCI